MQIYKGIREHAPLNFNQAGNPFSDAIDQVLQMDPMDVGIIGGTALDGGIGLVKGLPKGLALARAGAEVFGRGVRTVGKVMSDANDRRAGFNQAVVYKMAKSSMQPHVLRVGRFSNPRYSEGNIRLEDSNNVNGRRTRGERKEDSGALPATGGRGIIPRNRNGAGFSRDRSREDSQESLPSGDRRAELKKSIDQNKYPFRYKALNSPLDEDVAVSEIHNVNKHQILIATDKAMSIIDKYSESETDGSATDYENSLELIKKLREDAQRSKGRTAKEFEQLANNAEEVLSHNGAGGVAFIRQSNPNIDGTIHHEIAHYGQNEFLAAVKKKGKITSTDDLNDLEHYPSLKENPDFHVMQAHIIELDKGEPGVHPFGKGVTGSAYEGLGPTEVPAFIQSGHWKSAGLTRERAYKLLADYKKDIDRIDPDASHFIFDTLNDAPFDSLTAKPLAHGEKSSWEKFEHSTGRTHYEGVLYQDKKIKYYNKKSPSNIKSNKRENVYYRQVRVPHQEGSNDTLNKNVNADDIQKPESAMRDAGHVPWTKVEDDNGVQQPSIRPRRSGQSSRA